MFLNCFMVCIIESYRSLFEECESTSSSSYSTPSSSRTNSSKLKSPSFTQQQQQQQQQQLQQQQPVHHQRNHSFEKMPLRSKESSSFKDKLKQKLSRSFSTSWILYECKNYFSIYNSKGKPLVEKAQKHFNWKRLPSTHTTLFWRPYDVVLTLLTLYRRQNDVVCVLGNNQGWFQPTSPTSVPNSTEESKLGSRKPKLDAFCHVFIKSRYQKDQ